MSKQKREWTGEDPMYKMKLSSNFSLFLFWTTRGWELKILGTNIEIKVLRLRGIEKAKLKAIKIAKSVFSFMDEGIK